MVDPSLRVPKRRMGRPPLGLKKTTIGLSPDVIARIQALVGKQGVAAFLREAVRQRLELDERRSDSAE